MSLIQENISLKPYNTFGIDVRSRYFSEIFTLQQLAELGSQPIFKEVPLLVIGGGSNLLFTEDFKGLVIKVSIPGLAYAVDDENIIVTAGAGVVWNDLVNYSVANGFAGMENLSLIPGTAGASPIQNIGAYGVELKDIFDSCMAYEIATGEMRRFEHADCHFAYRDSIFKNELKGKYIITAVSFKLQHKAEVHIQYGAIQAELIKRNITEPGIADIAKVVAEIRVSKLPDPSTIGNAGSFFKNPVIAAAEHASLRTAFPELVSYPVANGAFKLAAGWLIEYCGFKGVVVGETGTWKNQALVLVNHGQATGKEVYSFSERIIDTVRSTFGVNLEREVNIL